MTFMKISENINTIVLVSDLQNLVFQFKSNIIKSFSDQQLVGIAQETKCEIYKDYIN